ncbi:MAG: tRNA guanosine(34) transglycosylase Tgt [Gammaproteobacteria bacterium]
MSFTTQVIQSYPHNHARVIKIKTPHGDVDTPVFMPVATKAAVNCMTPQDLHVAGSQIILGGNTYHMLCAPGLDTIERAGGMHRFMAWDQPMLTDSGGFQVFSLSKNSKICQIDEDGACFYLPNSNKKVRLTPQTSLAAQRVIGADIIMAFDQCSADILASKDEVYQAMQRTHRWLVQAKEIHAQYPDSAYGHRQALFGIIQGGGFTDLREQSARFVVDMALDGVAIGGESIGFDMNKTKEILTWIRPFLPTDKARYTMGVGLNPQDLIDVVAQGVDIFDCVAPTRNARHGSLYSGKIVEADHWLKFDSEFQGGVLHIKNSKFASDDYPIMADCECLTCQHYSRAYLHHLFKEKSVAYSTLACMHNIYVMHQVCEKMREMIRAS